MFTLIALLALIAGSSAFRIPSSASRLSTGSRLYNQAIRTDAVAPPGYKPMADGTYKKAGDFLKEYVLEMDNGAKAICRTFGGNAFTYVTKDGIEVMGKRKDAVDVRSDSKPYAGGAPHCFPQVNIYYHNRLHILTFTNIYHQIIY